jgi:multiple sugar transport system permease protein
MRKRRTFLGTVGRVAAYLTLSAAAFVSIFPVLWIMLMSIKLPRDAVAIPPIFIFQPTLDSYRSLFISGWQASTINIMGYLKNSIVIAFASTTISVFAAMFAAYSLSRFRYRGRNLIGFVIIATRMLPPIATIVPMFLLMNALKLLDTHLGLIMAYTAVNVPFAVWMLRGFIDEVPLELEDAARIDGCSRLGSLWRVVLPLIAPGMAAASVYAFLLAWNDFALALILTSRQAKTLPLMVMAFFTSEGVEWGPMAAAVTVALLPPVLFVILMQKHLAKGLTMGAVKG